MMLHTKYQGSMPFVFRQKDFFHVFPILMMRTVLAFPITRQSASLKQNCLSLTSISSKLKFSYRKSIFRLCDLNMQWTGTI